MKRVRKGFTLIELAIVIAAVAILGAIATHYYKNYTISAKATKIEQLFKKLADASLQFYQDTGGYPVYEVYSLWTNNDGGGHSIPNWNGPYIRNPMTGLHNNGARLTYPLTQVRNTYLGFYSCGACGEGDFVIGLYTYDDTAYKELKRIAQEVDKMMDDGNLSTGAVQWKDNWCGTKGALRYIIQKNPNDPCF